MMRSSAPLSLGGDTRRDAERLVGGPSRTAHGGQWTIYAFNLIERRTSGQFRWQVSPGPKHRARPNKTPRRRGVTAER